MPRKRAQAAATAEVLVTDSISENELEEDTVREYQKLNDKLDDVITKIKGRKESKRKK